MFNFKEKFKDRPSIELLQMLEQPEKYQPDALAAAKEIIEFRKLHNTREWEKEMAMIQSAKEQTKEKTAFEQTDDQNNIWIEDEKEVQDNRVARNQIFCIGLVLAVTAAISIFYNLKYTFFSYSEVDTPFNPYSLIAFAPELFTFIGIIFFYKREKTGWIILTSILTTQIIFRIVMLYRVIQLELAIGNGSGLQSPLWSFVIQLVLFSAALYQMFSSRIRKVYHADKKLFILAVSIMSFLYICFLIGTSMRH